MKLYLDIKKAKAELGKQKGGKFLRRVVTGKDSDGSPQYRYLRTPQEVEAYEKHHKKDDKEKEDTKKTHEKQKREHKEIEEKTETTEDSKEKKKPSLLVKDKKKVEKSLYVRR